MDIIKFTRAVCNKIKKLIELSRYNDFTIVEYFRKQGARIGEGCRILPRFLGDEPYLVKIGNNVAIAAGVTFITHDGGFGFSGKKFLISRFSGLLLLKIIAL